MNLLIAGLSKTTLLDYPGRVAATIFTGGCNFRCPFCHNGDLVLRPSFLERIPEEEVLSFLQKRKNVLGGVCITGGEPTLQPDLPEFVKRIKQLGFAMIPLAILPIMNISIAPNSHLHLALSVILKILAFQVDV